MIQLRPFLLSLSFGLIIAGILLLLLVEGDDPEIREIEVLNNRYLMSNEIVELSGLEPGIKLTPLERKRAEYRLAAHPVVKEVELEGDLNGLVRITVKERPCAAVIRSGESLYDVDAELRILSTKAVRCMDVPLITGNFEILDGFVKGTRLEEFISSWNELRPDFPELGKRISEIGLSDQKELMIYISRSKIRVKMKGPLTENNLRRMRAALSYFETNEGKSGVIDLRGPDAILLPEK